LSAWPDLVLLHWWSKERAKVVTVDLFKKISRSWGFADMPEGHPQGVRVPNGRGRRDYRTDALRPAKRLEERRPRTGGEFLRPTVTDQLPDSSVWSLGDLPRRLLQPLANRSWSRTSLQRRLLKIGRQLVRHARDFILRLADSHWPIAT